MTQFDITDPDVLEAENNRYLAAAFIVIPLKSGRIAILTPRRVLFKIVETWDEAKAVGPEAESGVYKKIPKPTYSRIPSAGDILIQISSPLDALELDL